MLIFFILWVSLYKRGYFIKKVYERLWTGQDTLLMDFNQTVGDTCNLFFRDAHGFIVTSIDSILINSVYHKRINYSNTMISLIEGIGSTVGIAGMEFDFENLTQLTCKGKNGIMQYPDTVLNPLLLCAPVLNLGLLISKKELATITLTPNPSHSFVNCSLSKHKIVSVKLFDMVGNVIIRKECNSAVVDLDISERANSVYILEVSDDKGNLYYQKLIKN